MGNFIILIGGPGLFKGCDKAHDQNWSNYIVPLQLAAMRDLYKKRSSETVHWVLYEPPFRNRWQDDSVITKAEKKQSDGYNLHSIRKAAADKIAAKGYSSYIARIKGFAAKYKITYKGISKPKEFWDYLKTMPDDSITRVWYSGHASGSALMLSLSHNSTCEPVAFSKDMIDVKDIKANKDLAKKFSKTSKAVSKFYGCYTLSFAESWHKVFGMNSAGAKNKIDFGVIDRPSSIKNVMERIEKTPTSVGITGWKEFK